MRTAAARGRFQYALDKTRFHYGAVVSGSRAEQAFGYVPEHPVELAALFAGQPQ
jgi:hypothetical protein